MGESIIPAENCEKQQHGKPPQSREHEPVILTGKEAVDFAEMVLSRPPKRSEALALAFTRRQSNFITE